MQTQATLANWRTAPYNRWAFHHVREIVPSADIANDPANVYALPSRPRELALGGFLEDTLTDALVVLHDGHIAHEWYASGMQPGSAHIFMSVSKSMLGLLSGILVARGLLDPEAPVTSYVPELEATAYKGATVRHLLDMRTGVAWDEDYLARTGPIIEYRKATGWNPLAQGEAPSDLHSFFGTLKDAEGAHGGRMHYVSPNSDLLGWVLERAAGRPYAELMSEHLWKPAGAEFPAYVTVDRLGAARAAGGMCSAARDLARIGQIVADGGKRGRVQVLPAEWIEDIATAGDADAWRRGSLADVFPGLPMRYRSQWYVLDGKEAQVLFCWGIHGQHLFVDRRHRLVVAKFSSQRMPIERSAILASIEMIGTLREALAR